MNVYIPFICLALGAAINWKGLPVPVLKAADQITNLALVVLMAVIGMNIGISREVMANLGIIGLNCLLISFAAVIFSVALELLFEKTVMPLEKFRLEGLTKQVPQAELERQDDEKGSKLSPLILVMPGFIAAGIVAGYFLLNEGASFWIDKLLTISLIFLYTGVGISLASNKEVFGYIKRLGFRIVFMPISIFLGCLAGGAVAGALLGVPLNWAMLSASGMGYYSLTGAFMTETYGIAAGTYGFIVNVLRDVLTVSLLPVLIRISKGSPIASGAAGCMDTMLVPVSRVVGAELSLVALISGTVLTFVVPVWLPIGAAILGGM